MIIFTYSETQKPDFCFGLCKDGIDVLEVKRKHNDVLLFFLQGRRFGRQPASTLLTDSEYLPDSMNVFEIQICLKDQEQLCFFM